MNNNFTLLTIIVEEALASAIEKEIEEMGAKGYTAWHVSGKGISGLRDNQWIGENIKIETIVSLDVGQIIMLHLQRKYFDRFPIIAFHYPVSVVRADHFS